MRVCGIVGLKNSGKTFIAKKLIEYFKDKKFKVASIKHAHDGFDIDYPKTDSFLHRKAGSQEVIISSSKRWAKIKELNNSKEKTLEELLIQLENPDIVIVEGYKNEKHFKIEIINELKNEYLFPNLRNVIAIISDSEINTKIKQFKKDEIAMIAEYMIEKTK